VIVPSYTFAATATAVLYCGGTPVFADILGMNDLSLDPEDVERRIGPRTKAVSVVHFAGYPAPVDALAELCEQHRLVLVEDAAHAPSARLGDRKLGTFGLAGAFSLFSNKILSVGEGGLLATDDDDVAELARSLRSHAMSSGTWARHRGETTGYDVTGLGFNYRLDEPRATLALSRLPRLEADIARRRELVREYRRRLAGWPQLIVPFGDDQVADSSCYVMPVIVRDPERRDDARRRLRERHNVQTSVFYPAVHEFTAYRARTPGVILPNTERAARSEITLPLYPHMTAAEQDRVIAGLEDVLA
jgi:dTDP-4-amino-4,6-dideoxygalactose transaminase